MIISFLAADEMCSETLKTQSVCREEKKYSHIFFGVRTWTRLSKMKKKKSARFQRHALKKSFVRNR